MFRHLLKSGIHCATVTDGELHNEGSFAIGDDRREAADLRASPGPRHAGAAQAAAS